MSERRALLFTTDGRGRVAGWSEEAERLFGRSAGRAQGRDVAEVLADGGADRCWLLEPAPDDGAGEVRWEVRQAVAEGPEGLDAAILDAVFTQSDVGVHVVDRDLRVVRVNPVTIGGRDIARHPVLGRPAVEAYAALGAPGVGEKLQEVLVTGRPAHDVLVRAHSAAGPPHDLVLSASVYRLQDPAGRPLGLVATVVDVTDRERAQARLRLLHRARTEVGSSLDVERTARELVDVAVPAFADSAFVALTDAVLRGRFPDPGPRDVAPVMRCAAVGGAGPPVPAVGSVLLPGLFGEDLPTGPVLRRGGAVGHPEGNRLITPLAVRGQVFGMVVFQRSGGSEPYADEDLAPADAIVSRTANCLENALRFTREHVIMTALQGWTLRQEEPTYRAVEVAQRHRPGGSGGGSWFDVIALPGARVALVVGQVEQPGLSAVASMSRLRTAVHSLTTLDLDPHELLARLHATTRRLASEQRDIPGVDAPTASCTFVVHDPVDGRIDVARAGRSLFAVVRPDGSVDTAPVGEGPLLGSGGPPFPSATFRLPEASTVCLASAPPSRGAEPPAERLLGALSHPERSPGEMADAVEELLDADRVLLVARTRHLTPDELARWPVEPDPSAVRAARRKVDEQLEAWGLPVDRFAVSIVVSELVTNAVRYGTPPVVLRLVKGERTLTCEVDDQAPTAPHLRHAKAVDEGGRGLHICASLAENWGVRYSDEGKTVWAEMAVEPATTNHDEP
ncbi:SpoIIE family protein phosphatase [Streptomyces sp. NPDC090077]|uniref:SpoIIE family protein phosphatase n=1 Tax=Streptomyces sp. NPDC090077 TaxID=3365938 RepID=UPI00380B9200